MEGNRIIRYPVMTEDAVNLIENENKLVFIVDLKSNKTSIKNAVKALYGVDVENVNLLITSKGLKKAYVKLKPEFKASDLAIKLGIL